MKDDTFETIGQRLLAQPETAEHAHRLQPAWIPDVPFNDPPVPAAVLIALVRRASGVSVLYTERSAGLRSHSGQVAFPGGKIDPEDSGPGDAALREAMEEVDLRPDDAKILGYMPTLYTGTNYLITPVVALVEPGTPFRPNPLEVDEVFEVPFEIIADERSYRRYSVNVRGEKHWTWQIEHDGHNIWGVTANLTQKFRETALDGVLA